MLFRSLFILLAASATATAQPPARLVGPPTHADSALKITLLTMGQGDLLWEYFGHDAIWVQDPRQPFDLVYNWGVFDFNAPGVLARFLRGDNRYILAASTIDNTIAEYKQANRPIWAQELNLTASEKRALVDYLYWNVQPQNREYAYDYYLDNCSTRARDAIDRVLGGQVSAQLKAIQTDKTYRWHSLRLMQADPLLLTGVEIALGRTTDTKLSAQEATFLPVQLMNYLRDMKVDGGRPLVSREYTLTIAMRPPEPRDAPDLWKALIPIGLLLGGLVYAVGRGQSRGARRIGATLVAALCGIIGFVGLLITLLMTVTHHHAAQANENIFLMNPLWLVVAIAGPMWILRGRAQKAAKGAAVGGAAIGACAILFHLTFLSKQPNWDVIGMILPIEIAVAYVIAKSYRFPEPAAAGKPVRRSGKAKN
jgi:hypothetical protein